MSLHITSLFHNSLRSKCCIKTFIENSFKLIPYLAGVEAPKPKMSVKKEDVEKFLDGNLDFAKSYFDRKLKPGAVASIMRIPESKVDIDTFKDMSSVEEGAIFYNLITDMQENINMEKVIFKILKRISALIHADRCSLFMYRQRNGVAELATRLFNVNENSELDDCVVAPDSEIVFPLDIGIVGHVAQTKKPVNVKDVTQVRYCLVHVIFNSWYVFYYECIVVLLLLVTDGNSIVCHYERRYDQSIF